GRHAVAGEGERVQVGDCDEARVAAERGVAPRIDGDSPGAEEGADGPAVEQVMVRLGRRPDRQRVAIRQQVYGAPAPDARKPSANTGLALGRQRPERTAAGPDRAVEERTRRAPTGEPEGDGET